MKIDRCKKCKNPVHIAHLKDESDDIKIITLDVSTPIYQVDRGVAVRAVNILGKYVAGHKCGEKNG